jgi:N-acetylmuramate 1-kinase
MVVGRIASLDREALKVEFLDANGFGQARREALSGDASTRRYERLHLETGTRLIFMDQPPSTETLPCPPDATPQEREALGYNAMARLAAGRVDAFVAVANWLRGQGLSAPEVMAFDASSGLAVLEDLGDDLFATMIARGQAETPLYESAINALARMHDATAPRLLKVDDGIVWPLLDYDDLALKTAGDLLPEWLPKLRPQIRIGLDAQASWEAIWKPIRTRAAASASVFCHRDYHAENLIWLPDRRGAGRSGLIDFQDAVRAHPAWDMSMLLHDARRDISPELETWVLERYCQLRPLVDREAYFADFRALGALNISRILGIFARLVTRDGKPRYAQFMPRLWGYLDRCLADPALSELKTWFDTYIPQDARQ